MHIRVNDTVEVISGGDKGVRAKVTRMLPSQRKVVVEGVNRVYKHLRRSQKNPQGGRLSKEMPISISNVLLVCPKCGKATRTGAKIHADGSKDRVCKKCKAEIGSIKPAKKAASKR